MQRSANGQTGHRGGTSRGKRLAGGLAIVALLASGAPAQERRPEFNLYGAPGLIDMPSAEMAEDALLSGTYGRFGKNARTTVRFQITPRLAAAFRYTSIDEFFRDGDTYYDRSFDISYQLMTETERRPAVTIGLQDFIGTGIYSAEYIAATKALTPKLRVTGGLGWGRLGSAAHIDGFGSRPTDFLAEGGVPSYDRWFRGPIGVFGGLSYRLTDKVTVKAEYSSDTYARETDTGGQSRTSSINAGLDYRLGNSTQASLYVVNGTEIGGQLTFHLNPRVAPTSGGREEAPAPVQVRAPGAGRDLGWTIDPQAQQGTRARLAAALKEDGLALDGLALEPKRAVLRLRNARYDATAQAVGRAARHMSRHLPASVETFVIVPVENGMAATAVTLQRADLEALEHDAAAEMLARTRMSDGFRLAPRAELESYPRLSWGVSPYLSFSIFDPDDPLRADAGLRFEADWHIAPGLVASTSIRKKVVGNLDDNTNETESAIPRVRTDSRLYAIEADPAIDRLTLAHYGRPAPDVYSRVTVGYLERMYAGISGEVLWKPVDSRLAFGAEVNYVQPRDYDQLFGLRSRQTSSGEIPAVNGHVSAYYDFGSGYHAQLDVGRYLAGDYGATLSVDREFGNGWRVGAYATLTDVPFEDFGEGSFDKGIRFTVPMSYFFGTPTKTTNTITIQSLKRDGGARLEVDGRLYETVRDYHRPMMEERWGKFWR